MSSRPSKKQKSLYVYVIQPLIRSIKRSSLLIFIVFSVSLIIADRMGSNIVANVRVKALDIINPVVKIAAFPINFLLDAGGDLKDLFIIKNENIRLKQENSKLRYYYNLVQQVESQNKELHKLLNFVEEPSGSYITTRVTSTSSGPFNKNMIVNAGSKDNVKKGDIVVNQQGLVGRIIEVGNLNSRLLLITDYNSNIPVITGNSRERAIVQGYNTEYLQLSYLSNDSKVKIGEMVFTSGDGESIPSGIPIGRIISIDNGNISVKPEIDWNRLEFVNIIDYRDQR